MPKKEPRRVGFFGGSFDPIHLGHLNLAFEMQEKHDLEEVWFCPANISPHKLENEPSSSNHRLEMLRVALVPFAQFKIIMLELDRPPPSFTYDTIQILLDKATEDGDPLKISLIIGDDSLSGLPRWNRIDELVQLVPFLVGSRQNQQIFTGWPAALSEAIRKGMTDTRLMEVSSSDIRQRIAKGLPVAHLIPCKVMDYIELHELYLDSPL